MSNRTVSIFMITFLLTMAHLCRASAKEETSATKNDSALKVYLQREATINSDIIHLGQVSIIRGQESLAAKANRIILGRFSMPGQEIIIDRTMVLGRLASNRIPASNVLLTGAENVTVKQQQKIIEGNEFVEMALSFLQKNSLIDPNCQLNPVRVPKDLAIPEPGENVEFSTHSDTSTKNPADVRITVLVNGKEVGQRQVTFNLKYLCRTAVTVVDIPEGTLISPENIKIEKTPSDYPEPVDWTPPYGLIAKRRLPAETVICSHMVGPVKPAVSIERNQTVVVRIERPGLSLITTGTAAEKGQIGDYIKVKVQITNAPRTITAKIKDDGSVEPVF